MQWNDTAIERFRQKIRVDGDCWRWTGAHSRSYATIGLKPYHRTVYAHRFAYEYFIGPIPEGMEIDHVVARGCRFRDCVNPAHLEAVTHRTNVLRSSSFTAIQAQRTHCPQGHAYDQANTRLAKGKRSCIECGRKAKHAKRTGRIHERWKLTQELADRMRLQHVDGQSARSLAKEFTVSYTTAKDVVRGRIWVTGNPDDRPPVCPAT